MPRFDYVTLVRELRKPKQAVCATRSFSLTSLQINIHGNECVSFKFDANSEVQQIPPRPPPQVLALRLANAEAALARVKERIERERRGKYFHVSKWTLQITRSYSNAPSKLCGRRLYWASLTVGRNMTNVANNRSDSLFTHVA